MFKAKKRFGQNFLKDKNILRTIISTADISPEETIIEVGPGKGALTEHLLQEAKKVVCLEKDRDLIPILEEKFFKKPGFKLINIDALEYHIPQIKYKVVANIPYNITSPLINFFLKNANKPDSLTLLIQYEVAKKICDKEQSSVLNLQVKLYGDATYIKKVKNTAFYPRPKVDSAIIHIKTINRFSSEEAEKIEKIIKTAFSQKRKKLIRTLAKNLDLPLSKLETIFETLNLPQNIRPQNLSIEDYNALSKAISGIKG
ncbi:ribosomal RNA small subunit methyltransferase A [Candidatus Peregrinibacteria bacterium]|nr:ribosomal RNA small subunit methyltransferase A [Candidatus Peregrinibacteria bacterium]